MAGGSGAPGWQVPFPPMHPADPKAGPGWWGVAGLEASLQDDHLCLDPPRIPLTFFQRGGHFDFGGLLGGNTLLVRFHFCSVDVLGS